MNADLVRCPRCRSESTLCSTKPTHMHRCLDCGYDGTRDWEVRHAGFAGYGSCACPTPFLCSERGDCTLIDGYSDDPLGEATRDVGP